MNDENKSLTLQENETADENQSFAESLGGFQALVLFVVLGLSVLVVFAFPTPNNPAVTSGDDGSIIEVLENLETPTQTDAAEEIVTEEATNTPTAEPTTTPTEQPTEEPTVEPTAVPTEQPTEVPTEAPTEEDVTEATTEQPTEAPTEGTANAPGRGRGMGGPMTSEEAITMIMSMADVENGERLFNEPLETSSGVWMCSSCHSVDEAQTRLVGPGLYGLYAREERLGNTGPPHIVGYTEQSIINPQVYLVEAEPPYPENLMPQNYGELLTQDELHDIIGYLMTLGNPDY